MLAMQTARAIGAKAGRRIAAMLPSRVPAGQAPHATAAPEVRRESRRRALLVHSMAFGTLLAIMIPARWPAGDAGVLGYALPALFLALAVFAATRLLLGAAGPRRRPGDALRFAVLGAAGCLVVSGGYFAAFFPAVMSYDSVEQWRQMVAFRFNDHHPAAHTLVGWMLTRLWFSPAAIALFQMLALAAVTGAAVHQLRSRGAPAGLVAAFAVFQALQPLNGMYAVTLWKDVLFGAAVFGSILMMTAILDSGGGWLERRFHQWLLGGTLCAVALLRHNGVVVAASILVALGLASRGRRARVAMVAGACVAAVFLVRGPLYDRLEVERAPSAVPVIQAWELGAMITSGAGLRPGEEALAGEILPLDDWRRYYSPYTVDPLTNAPAFNGRFFHTGDNVSRLGAAWRELARRHPRVLAHHLVRMSSIAWRIRPFPDGYTMSMWFSIDPNGFGLATRPLWPRLHDRLEALARGAAARPGWSELLCRPATYLAVALFAVALSVLGSGRRREALVLAPILATALPLFIYCPCQDTRYLYPVILAAPFLLARAIAGEPAALARTPETTPSVKASASWKAGKK